MTVKNTTTQKLISSLIIFTMLAPAVFLSFEPKQARAVGGVPVDDYTAQGFLGDLAAETTADTTLHFKDWAVYVGKELLKMAAKRLLHKMAQATINWINSDFHGSPLYLENPDSFFRDIAKSELKTVVNMFGYDSLRFPFGKDFALNVINSYRSQLENNAQYTLSNLADAEYYRNDFNYGGWNAFLINTQYPQNNYLGFQMLATEELARRVEGTVQNAAQKVQTMLQQGMGFLSPQTCPSNPSYNNGTNEFIRPSFQYNAPLPTLENPEADVLSPKDQAAMDKWYMNKVDAREQWAEANTCPGGLVNTTPGSVAAHSIMTALDSPFLSTALDGAIGNELAAVFDALINHFLDKGLNALSESISSAPEIDNWSYDGVALDGDNNNTLDIPQNVSLRVGETTSTIISGGNGDYSVQPQSNISKAIAIASIDLSGSAPKLKITAGTTSGTTSVTVQDSSFPTQYVVVVITVSAIGALSITPANITTGAGPDNQIIAKISGGEEPYYIQTKPKEEIVSIILSGTNLIVTGITAGSTYIGIKDSSSTPKTIQANISIVDPSVLFVSQENITAYTGEPTDIIISGGKKPYQFAGMLDYGVADAEITNDVLTITGKKQGGNSITIRDSSLDSRTVTIAITILDPLGSCSILSVTDYYNNYYTNSEIKDISEPQCKSNGGQWTPNP
ncbi:MAG: hypothetical protein ABIG99_02335 [Patescibacteria group bacterium]